MKVQNVSYFLYNLTKKQLNKILFPLADKTKEEVRHLALEFDLPVANKKESTDICFINKGELKDYLKRNIKAPAGDIINIDTGEVLGKHIGLMYYTIGQRRGLNIGGTEKRLFVAKKDLENNILYVAMGDENKYLISHEAIIEEVNLLDELPLKCTAKFRYRQQDNEVMVNTLQNGELVVKYPQGVRAVTPGQACVLYNGDECLGGGIIKTVR